MREILFRGKTADGDWIEGYFFKGKWYLNDTEIFAIAPIDLAIFPHCEMSEYIEIIPDTVGQYTGLTDKNGKKIFEGDIVDILTENEEIGVVVYDDGGFLVKADGFTVDFHSNIWGKDVEVIGNIHDNPELLKGGVTDTNVGDKDINVLCKTEKGR